MCRLEGPYNEVEDTGAERLRWIIPLGALYKGIGVRWRRTGCSDRRPLAYEKVAVNLTVSVIQFLYETPIGNLKPVMGPCDPAVFRAINPLPNHRAKSASTSTRRIFPYNSPYEEQFCSKSPNSSRFQKETKTDVDNRKLEVKSEFAKDWKFVIRE